MALDTKVNSKTLSNMEWAHRDSSMAKRMSEIMRKIDLMVKGNTIGRMEITLKAVF